MITGEPCDKEKIEASLLKLGGVEHQIKISSEQIKNKLGLMISEDIVSKIFERFWYFYNKEGNVFIVNI